MGETEIVVIEGLAIEVTDFVCEPSPPTGSMVELRFHGERGLSRRLPEREVMIEFQVRRTLYYGLFLLISCTLAPDFDAFTYESRSPVIEMPE